MKQRMPLTCGHMQGGPEEWVLWSSQAFGPFGTFGSVQPLSGLGEEEIRFHRFGSVKLSMAGGGFDSIASDLSTNPWGGGFGSIASVRAPYESAVQTSVHSRAV